MRAIPFPTSAAFAAVTLLALSFTGCSTPETRARERPAAMRALSPADQRLALAGRIHEGFSKDAVYIAWGSPDRTYAGSQNAQPFESWFYTQTQFGAAGGYGYGGYYGGYPGFYGPSIYVRGRHGRGHYAGGYGGYFGGPPFIYPYGGAVGTEVPYRKATFVRAHVTSFETLQSDATPGHAAPAPY